MSKPEPEESHEVKLVRQCIVFTDKHGKVLSKGSNPFSQYLHMEYRKDDLRIWFRVQSSPYSNGSSRVEVRRGEEILLRADGSYMAAPFDIVVSAYIPGPWEEIITK